MSLRLSYLRSVSMRGLKKIDFNIITNNDEIDDMNDNEIVHPSDDLIDDMYNNIDH